MHSEDGVVEAEVMAVNKGGAMLQVEGLRAFMPGSHYLPGQTPTEALVGQKLKARRAPPAARAPPPSPSRIPSPIPVTHAPRRPRRLSFLTWTRRATGWSPRTRRPSSTAPSST